MTPSARHVWALCLAALVQTQTDAFLVRPQQKPRQQQSCKQADCPRRRRRIRYRSTTALWYDSTFSHRVCEKLQSNMEELRDEDAQSPALSPEDLKIVYQDEHLIVVDKPFGVLSTSRDFPSLAKTVYEKLNKRTILGTTEGTISADDGMCMDLASLSFPLSAEGLLTVDQMVVHRLGKNTSGLMVLGLTVEGVRGLQTMFRTRKVRRQYEALVWGHIGSLSKTAKREGLIRLPIMRDVDHPPFMRVSTTEQQQRLLQLDPTIVPRNLLRAPKMALTYFAVLQREYWDPHRGTISEESSHLPVSRLLLTSISGRTHQLNVHCAASGHPIVGDSIYGSASARAAPYGGLSSHEVANSRDLPEPSSTLNDEGVRRMCIHASVLRFRHPITREMMEFTSAAPF